MKNLELQQQWIKFSKQLKQEEQTQLVITDQQYKWFGETMEDIKNNSDFPSPCGSACRQFPRAFFTILKGGNSFVKDFLSAWSTQSEDDFNMACMTGDYIIYDLIGYGVNTKL